MTTTTDLSKFGYRELELLETLLKAMREQGLPENFYPCGVVPMFNQNSGEVFLTNDSNESALMNGDDLEIWHWCSYCGHEGFAQDFDHEPKAMECEEQMWELQTPSVQQYDSIEQIWDKYNKKESI